jgi:hypothetical protein
MTSPAHIRIIGDVHGRISPPPKRKERNVRDLFPRSPYGQIGSTSRYYLSLVGSSQYSIQVGDMGFDYSGLNQIESNKHRAIAGNHDNIPQLTGHFLGDYGIHSFPVVHGLFEFFFMRGARSIDADQRTEGLNWWREEELSSVELESALALYRSHAPRIVITHECPAEVVTRVATVNKKIAPSDTSVLLQRCFECHAPEYWFFGHHHRNWVFDHFRGTKFVCLNELAYFDFDTMGEPIYESPR